MNLKEIKGYNGKYLISDCGKVFNSKTSKQVAQNKNTRGYLTVNLNNNTKIVHRLVADAFIENKLSKPYVNHIDTNKLNNHYTNLEWCTQRENVKHYIDNTNFKRNISGIENKSFNGEKHGMAKLVDLEVIEIRKNEFNLSNYDLSKLYNVSESTIRGIINNKTWKHLL